MRSTLPTTLLLLCAAACVSPEEHRKVLSANTALNAQISQLSESQSALKAENDRLRRQVDELGKRAADADWIREQKAKIDDLLKRYEGASGGGLPGGVELVSTPEGLAFRVLGGVLFSPGSDSISEQGQKTLQSLLATLKQQGKRVRVDGHTDDQPIVKSQWKTNLWLSVNRAHAVAQFLIQNGLGEDKVAIAGYGEFRPAVESKDEAARSKNRRVEILMLER